MERDRRIEIALYERQYNSFVLAIAYVKNMLGHGLYSTFCNNENN